MPGVGDVSVTIDEEDFFQAGYKLRSLASARLVSGGALSAEQYQAVRTHLKKSGRINQ